MISDHDNNNIKKKNTVAPLIRQWITWLIGRSIHGTPLHDVFPNLGAEGEKENIYIKEQIQIKDVNNKEKRTPTLLPALLDKNNYSLQQCLRFITSMNAKHSKTTEEEFIFRIIYVLDSGKKKIRHIVDRSHPPCTYPVLNYKTIKRESKSELSSKIRRVKPETGSCLTQLLIRNSWKNFWSLITSYHLWKSPGPNLLLKQCRLKVAAQDHVQTAFELLQGGKLHPNVILVEDRIPMFPCWQNAQHIFWRAHYTMGEEWADGSSSEGFRKWSYIRLAASP